MASGRPGSPKSWNRYAYVQNNPLRLIDPSGLMDKNPSDEVPDASTSQDRIIVTKATLTLDSDKTKIDGVVDGNRVVFNIEDSAVLEKVFGGDSFTVQVKVNLPEDATSLKPTQIEEIPAEGKSKGENDTTSKASGSQVRLPENSNLSSVLDKPRLKKEGESRSSTSSSTPRVTTANTGLGTATASFTLRAASSSTTKSNTIFLNLEAPTEKGQINRATVNIAIKPAVPKSQ